MVDQYQFHNERSVNDPSAKTDFCDMLERRKANPINLAILCMHLYRKAGAAEGIAIPDILFADLRQTVSELFLIHLIA